MLKYLKIISFIIPVTLFSQINAVNLSKPDFTYWDFEKKVIQSTGSFYVDFLGAGKEKHGEWTYYDRFGKIEEKRNYFRGDLNGKAVMYYANGKLKQEGYFKRVKKENLETYISRQDSVYREWYETGKLEEEGMFKLDRQIGIWKYYYLDGREKSHEEVIDSVTYIRSFWISDSIHTQTIKDGNGEMVTFHTTGSIKELYNYKNGRPDGPFEDHSVYGYFTLLGSFK